MRATGRDEWRMWDEDATAKVLQLERDIACTAAAISELKVRNSSGELGREEKNVS